MKNSNIQSKKFYKQAEDMAPGWGKYLRAIDKLKDKFQNNKPLTINEACWILWAEKYVNSSDYLKFKEFIKKEKLDNKKFGWAIWDGLFNAYMRRSKELNTER